MTEFNRSRDRRIARAETHGRIKAYKDGEATWNEAFAAAYDASENRKGSVSGFGRALGGIVVRRFVWWSNSIAVYGVSPVVAQEAGDQLHTAVADVRLMHYDIENPPDLGNVIADPLAEGFMPLPPDMDEWEELARRNE